jgi:NAD kinase
MNIEYAIIVKNETRLESLNKRFNTVQQSKFYIEKSGGDFEDYEKEDVVFHDSLSVLQRRVSKVIKNKIVERSFLPNFLFSPNHVIIVIGQDGLVANTAKYSNGVPIIGVNPDPERFDGVLLPFQAENFIEGLERVLENKYQYKETSFAEARLNDGQRLLAFNDLFIGAASHVSARYEISFNNKKEEHSSSGIIVSTQAGSTGWMSSIFNMTYGMQEFIAHQPQVQKQTSLKNNELLFAVREPFASRKTQTGLMAGIVDERTQLVIESFMPQNGVIFSDGIEHDFLKFNSGSIATIGVAKEKAKLVLKGEK